MCAVTWSFDQGVRVRTATSVTLVALLVAIVAAMAVQLTRAAGM